MKKYKNLSRFSALSGIPYHKVYSILNHRTTVGELNMLKEAFNETEAAPMFNEVTQELIAEVDSKLSNISDIKQWCRETGIQGYWLTQFLNGEIVFKNQKVERLLSML
jgi:hypothetical protein